MEGGRERERGRELSNSSMYNFFAFVIWRLMSFLVRIAEREREIEVVIVFFLALFGTLRP